MPVLRRFGCLQAEVRAFACCISEWLNRSPERSVLERCSGCSGGDPEPDTLLPFGRDQRPCLAAFWAAWYGARWAKAIAALLAMGIARGRVARRFREKRRRKMGGLGSGRSGGFGRNTVETCRSLDVNQLHRAGCLMPGWTGSWQWTRDGERVAWISLRAEDRRMVLSYRYRRNGGEWQDVEECIDIEYVPCRFGGHRPYFLCPCAVNGVACRRRVAKLYGAERYFLCRHCYHLAYASQREDAWGRALRRGNKIRLRLGGDPGAMAPFPEKPRRMWWRTYERLHETAFRAKLEADTAFVQRGRSLLMRIEGQKRKLGFWR